MKICLILDHPQRDLDGCLKLINKIYDHFEKIDIIPMYHIYELFLKNYDVIILQNLRPENIKIAKILKKSNKFVFVIDNEGMPFGWLKDKSYLNTFVENTSKSLNLIYEYFLWGDFIFDELKKYNVQTKKLYVTGHHRFDLFKKKYHYLYKNRKTKKKVIVFNTNFVSVNSRYTKKKSHFIETKKIFYYNNDDAYKNINESFENQKIIYNNFIKLINKVSKDFRDCKILINTHPFEDYKSYKNKLKMFKNVLVLKNNFKSPELYKNYKNMITYNSTTCIETMLSDFKTLSPNFVDPNKIINNYFKDFVVECKTYEQLKIKLENDNNNFVKQNEKKNLSYLFNNQKADASDLIADRIIKVSKKKVSNIHKNRNFFKFIFSQGNLVSLSLVKNIVKLFIIFLLGSRGFYNLKKIFKRNYKLKTINIYDVKKFLYKLNPNRDYNIKFSKPQNMKFFIRNLTSIQIK